MRNEKFTNFGGKGVELFQAKHSEILRSLDCRQDPRARHGEILREDLTHCEVEPGSNEVRLGHTCASFELVEERAQDVLHDSAVAVVVRLARCIDA